MSQEAKPVVKDLPSSFSRTTTDPGAPPLKPEATEQSTMVDLSALPKKDRKLAEKLFDVVRKGNVGAVIKVVKELIAQRKLLLLNVRDCILYSYFCRYETPLFAAILGKHLAVVTYLLSLPEVRAVINQADHEGQTPLFAAIETRNLSVVEHLLSFPEVRAVISQADHRGRTPLFAAIETGNLSVVEHLLSFPEVRTVINQADLQGETPLVVAISKGHLAVVAYLLSFPEVRAVINQTDPQGETPLVVAVMRGESLEVMKYLLSFPEVRAVINRADDKGETLLAAVASIGALVSDGIRKYNFEKGIMLLKYGANLQVAEEWLALQSRIRKNKNEREGFAEALFNLKCINKRYQSESPLTKAQYFPLAQAGDRQAQYDLGWCYEIGFGVTWDIAEAAKWYAAAAVAEHPLAQIALARLGQAGVAQTMPFLSKAETKQEVVKETSVVNSGSLSYEPSRFNLLSSSLVPISSSGSSSQTTTQATIQRIQNDLSQGNVEALLNQVNQPAGIIAADSEMGTYLQEQALTDIIKAQTEGSKKAELKDSQRANLVKAMEAVLKADPAAITRPNKKEGGLTPLDLAIQLDLPKNVITRLQQTEQAEYDRQTLALQQKLEQLAMEPQVPQKPKLDAESKALCAELVPLVTNTIADLKKVRAYLSQTQSASTNVSSSPVLIPIAGATVSLVNAPVSLSAAQEAQIALGQQLLNIKLTQVFTKALAIKYKLVDAHNQSRAGTLAEGGFKLVADLLPLPGAGLIAKALVAGAKKITEKRDIKRQDRRIGEVSTIDQAAERVAALVRSLTRRFQLVFAQLQPDSLEIFVDQIVDRMVHYWDAIPEKLKKAGVKGEVLKEGLVDCTRPLSVSPSSSSVSALSESQQFDNLMENMLLGTSLWKDREAKASSRIAKSSGRKGFLGKVAGVIAGDRLVTLQTPQGPQDAAVQHICHHAPPVTWTGVNHHQNGPVYYYGDPAANVDLSVDQNLPLLYLSKEECGLRGYAVDQSKPAPLSLLIAPKELDLSDTQRKERELEAEIMRLRQQLGVAEARADKEKTRADAAEIRANTAETALGQVKESKEMSASQKLPVSEVKAASTPQNLPVSRQSWTPRAVGQIPSPPPSPEPPDKSLSTQSDSTVTPVSPTVI